MEDRIDVLKRMIRETYLELPAAEEETLARDVDGLLHNVELLANLPIEATAERPAVDVDALRPDDPAPPLAVEDALANAPARHDGFISVPKVINVPGKGIPR
jgi:aspartyl/glutamyl-tRNA(Asn/Gln) amidotransferase C subunit